MTPTLPDLFRAACAKSGGGLVVIDRDYELFEPILVRNQSDLHVVGTPGRRRVIRWTGNADHLFDLANCRDSLFTRLKVEVHGRLGNVFHYWRKVADHGAVTPTNNRHQSIACLVSPGGSLYRLASHDQYNEIEAATGIDENNEFGLYEDIDLDGSVDGIRFLGQQSHGHVLARCRLNVQNDAVVSSGWFSATDVSGSGLSGAAFHLVGVSAPVHIVRPNFEAVTRLLVAEAPNAQGELGQTGDTQAILIEGGSTRCDRLHADGAVIDLKSAGPLRVVGHQFGSGQQPVPHIRTWHPNAVVVEACDVGSWDSFGNGKPLVRFPDGSGDRTSRVNETTVHTAAGSPVPYFYTAQD